MRIVLDTNVLVSAMLKKGSLPYQLLAAWDSEKYDLITSEEQLSELDRVLNYDKLKKYIPAEKAAELVARLRESATSITGLPVVNYSTDPADNLILATAIAGQAELLVTGDKKHLLSLGKVEAVTIVTVNDALDKLNPPEERALMRRHPR